MVHHVTHTRPRRVLRGLLPLFSLLGLLAAVTALTGWAPTPTPVADDARLLILGFDGGDGRTVEEMMDADELPNFKRLRDQGTFARLGTSIPNESPTSWASLNSGQNPGKTNISGFVKRGWNSKKEPSPGFGFIDTRDERGIEEFDNLPLPAWSSPKLAGVAGGAVLVAFLLVFCVLLRLRFTVSAVLSIVLALVGAFVGWEAGKLLPRTYPRVGNPHESRNFWDYAGDHGVRAVVLEAAQAFDMETPHGVQMLAGLGVPDARGALGDWFIYTDDELLFDRPPEGTKKSSKGSGLTAGTKFRVDFRDGKIQTHVYGPVNFFEVQRLEAQLEALDEQMNDPSIGYKKSVELREKEDALEDELRTAKRERVAVDLVIEKRGPDSAAVIMDGHEQVLEVGGWSDFYHLTFPLNAVLKVKAVTRCKLVSLEGPFELFLNTIDLDPEDPPFWQSITEPHDFAPELVRAAGTFETYGWACVTMPFKDNEVSPETLLEDIEFTMNWRKRVAYSQLERSDWNLFMSVFSTPDRVQHMMYKYYDRQHPQYDPIEANRKVTFFGKEMPLSEVIPEIYRQADQIVGDVLDKYVGPDDTLLVCSDHGFQSFRRQVNLNNWLHENGYLAVKKGLAKGDASGFAFVDWSETQAYAMGLGFIYVNQKGREGRGIVPAGEKEALLDRIQADLLQAVDPKTGVKTVIESYRVADHHSGPYLEDSADLVLGFAPTYRVSWKTTGGGMLLEEKADGSWAPGDIYTDNTSPWSGGHPSVARDHVRGIFFCNREVDLPEGGPDLMHIAPTALELLGVPIPDEMDLEPLRFVSP